MSSPADILIHELEQARAHGDDARVLGLAAAILAQGDDAGGRALVWLEESSERLIAAVGDDLDAAVVWARTWARYARTARARERTAELEDLLARVQSAEQVMQGALVAGDIASLRAALAGLPPDGRRRETAAIAQHCAALLEDRLAETQALHRDLAQLVPYQLERAIGLAARLATIAPATIPARDDLARRLAAVNALHRQAEAAFESGPVAPLRAAVVALHASPDRRGDSEALLTLSEAELTRRQSLVGELRTTFAAVVESDIDAAADTLIQLAALDPSATEAARLTEITTARMRLSALHATIKSGLADPTVPEVRAALRELKRSPLRRIDSDTLVTAAQTGIERIRLGHRNTTRTLAGFGALAAGVALVAGLLWWRDHSARAEIGHAADPEHQLELVRAYNGSFHLFAVEPMQALETRLVEECDQLAFDRARRQPTIMRRIGDLEAYLLRPGARRVAEARTALADLRTEMEDAAFASANRVADPVARLSALADYATRARDPGRAARARELVTTLRREIDDAAWASVAASDPASRGERAADYLRETANVLHRDEAERVVTAARGDADRRSAKATDDQAWATAQGSLTGARDYLARPDGRHRAAAESAVAAFLRADEAATRAAAWAAAAGDGPPEERLARLRAFLADDDQRAHADEARAAIATIERALDDAAWALATEPGTQDEVNARLGAYLAGPTLGAHRTEAEEMRQAQARTLDAAAWKSAMAAEPPTARITALDAYLAGPTARGYTSASKEELARCFARLAEADVNTLAGLPRGILVRVAPAALARLPTATLAALPLATQAQVPLAPPWAGESGVDGTGRWATLPLDTSAMRLRWIFPGTIATADGSIACAQGFWLAERECSQSQWMAVMDGAFSDGNPSHRQDPQLPVENVTWRDVRDFVAACNARLKMRKHAQRVRLPSATEWAWLVATAADGPAGIDRGTATPWDEARLATLAWSSEQAGGQTRACADGSADAWGIVNLFGNVREWVGAPDDRSGMATGGSFALPRAVALRAPLALAREARFADLGVRLVVSP